MMYDDDIDVVIAICSIKAVSLCKYLRQMDRCNMCHHINNICNNMMIYYYRIDNVIIILSYRYHINMIISITCGELIVNIHRIRTMTS